MKIEDFIKMDIQEFQSAFDLADPWSLVDVYDENTIVPNVDNMQEHHISYIMSYYLIKNIEPPARLLNKIIRSDSNIVKRYALQGMMLTQKVPDEILTFIRQIILTTKNDILKEIAVDVLVHHIKNKS